ncbi:GWxTD domain-containing protein [bacterium]|nr:GWxTD domain-containing protein [bacterium]
MLTRGGTRRRIRYGFAALLFLATAAPARAGDFPARSVGRPAFHADVVVAPAAPGSVQVQVSWEIPYPQLVFRYEDGWHRARYDVSVVFLKDGTQIDGDVWLRRVRAKSTGETRDAKRTATGRKIVTLPAGSYRARIGVTDRTSKGRSQVEGEFQADFRRVAIALGDIEFFRTAEGVTTRNTSHEVRLGEQGHSVRITLLPSPGKSGAARLRWKLRDPGRDTLFEGDTTVVVGAGPLVTELPLRTERLDVGEHRLEVVVTGPRDETDRRTARLHVRLTSRWFETRRKSALEVFEQVAGKDEFDALRGAEGAEWTRKVREFWARHDPSPGTEGNEFRNTVQARMEMAATLFVEPFRQPGWRTDRGHVLLRHGEPTRRSRIDGTFERAASELWEYDEPRRSFLFVDERGSGEFWLQG